MPEDNNPSSAEPDGSNPKPKVRRISNKAPAREPLDTPESESAKSKAPDLQTDAESASGALSGTKPDQKRSNRRRRGKGKSAAQAPGQPQDIESPEPIGSPAQASTEADPESVKKNKPEPDGKPQIHQRAPQPPRRKLDPEKVAKNAWKIYLAEVSEEGVALIADNDARELARRCFRLSEIFLEEADKRN